MYDIASMIIPLFSLNGVLVVMVTSSPVVLVDTVCIVHGKNLILLLEIIIIECLHA